MNILIVTPAGRSSKAGNRATADRWAQLLQAAGHRVRVACEYQRQDADLMIGLHAWRSHEAITAFADTWPGKPLIVVLTGTDIYQFQHSEPEPTRDSMDRAHVLIGLHRQVVEDIPEAFREKVRVVLQSAAAPERCNNPPPGGPFTICVIGHLRQEKDSLRAALAAGLLPNTSSVRVVQAGKPHNDEWRLKVEEEVQSNPRFQWLGEIDREEVQALMVSSGAMVISSLMEGGANVVSEACRAGLPIIASDIAGNRGLLGDDYPGYYPAGDTQALAGLMLRVETEPGYLQQLKTCVEQRARDFTPEAEQAALLAAIEAAMT